MGNADTAIAEPDALLKIERADKILTVGLNRPAKRNALNDSIIQAIGDCFATLPEDIGAVVIHGIGEQRRFEHGPARCHSTLPDCTRP